MGHAACAACRSAIGLVDCVPGPIVVQRDELGARVRAGTTGRSRALVDVIPQMEDHVEVFGGGVPICREVADLVVLARDEGEAQPAGGRAFARKRPGPADGAQLVAHAELIPVPAGGVESVRFDVHRVSPLGAGDRLTAPDDLPQPIVSRDQPVDLDVHRWHPAAGQRIGCETRPEHDALGRRIPGRDAQRER